MKNFDRRLKILSWRLRRRRKGPPRPRHELAAVAIIPLLPIVFMCDQFHLFETLYLLAAVVLVTTSLVLWVKGREGEGRRLIRRLSVFALIALVFVGTLAHESYKTYFRALPDQLAADAYVKANAEGIGENVDFFMEKYSEGMLVEGYLEPIAPMHLSPWPTLSLVDFARHKAPLIVASLKDEISMENAKRHLYWNSPDVVAAWMAYPVHIPKEDREGREHPVVPEEPTYPFIYGLFCHETRNGDVHVQPLFLGAPSFEVDRPDFVPNPDLRFVDLPEWPTPGKINLPHTPYMFDASTIDYLAPLENVCRSVRDTPAPAE